MAPHLRRCAPPVYGLIFGFFFLIFFCVLATTSTVSCAAAGLALPHRDLSTPEAPQRQEQGEVLSLLAQAGISDGFLVFNASVTSPNMSRVAFSLVPQGAAAFSSMAPSRSDPSVVEVVAAHSKQRLMLLGLRLGAANDSNDSMAESEVVYARELVVEVGGLAGVAVDWRRRRAFFAENDGVSVRAVSLDLPGPVALKQVPVLVQLPNPALGASLLGDLALDAERETLYLGLSMRANSGPAVPAVWSFAADGSGVSVARNLSQRSDSWSPMRTVLALGGGSGSGSTAPARLWVMTHNQDAQYRSYYDLTAFDLPLTPDSGNGTVLPLRATINDPTGLVVVEQEEEDTARAGWVLVADRTRGVARVSTNGTEIKPGFIKLASGDQLVAIGLTPRAGLDGSLGSSSNDSNSSSRRVVLSAAQRRVYAARVEPAPPGNLTVLAEAQSNDAVLGMVVDPASCRMWYLNGMLLTRQTNDWRPAKPLLSQYTYSTSNLASDKDHQLYFARNFPGAGEILRVQGSSPSGSGNATVVVSSFGLEAKGPTLVTDPVGRKLYYLSGLLLFRSELDGSDPTVFVRTRSGTGVSSFTVDVKQRLVFFGEGFRPGCDIYQVDIDAPGTPTPVLIYSSPLTRSFNPPTSLASDPINRVLYALQCSSSSLYNWCNLYAIALGSSASASTATLLATYDVNGRLPNRVQFDAEREVLYLAGSAGRMQRCPLPRPGGNLTCFDLHLNPNTRLVAIAVDARRRELFAIDEPSRTVVRFEMLAEPDGPQPNLGSAFEVLHQLGDNELPSGYAPQLMQIDPSTGLLYVRTATGIGRGVMRHARPAPYSPLEPLINDSAVAAFAVDPVRKQIHWIHSKKLTSQLYENQLWSAAMDGSGGRMVADWNGSPCGQVPIALHLEPVSPANASIVPPAFWTVWGVSQVCHWNGTVMLRVAAINNYGNARTSAYDPVLQLLHITGTYWQDVPTIFTVNLRTRAVSMMKQDDSSIEGIAVSSSGGDLFVAQTRSWLRFPIRRSVVVMWNTNSTFSRRQEVLRSAPLEMSLIDMQHPARPVYFIDSEGSSVWTARSDGTGERVTHNAIQAEHVNASAFWVDTRLGLLVWSERIQLDTRVADLDTLGRVATALLVPVARTTKILVDGERGWMYWSDVVQWRVMRARLDGREIECLWVGGYPTLLTLEPATGDLIVARSPSMYNVVVQRRTPSGVFSDLISLYVGSFSPLAGLGPVVVDPRTANNSTCQRLWMGASVRSGNQEQGFLGTACVGAGQVTRLVNMPQVYYAPPHLQLLPDLTHCLPPTGLGL